MIAISVQVSTITAIQVSIVRSLIVLIVRSFILTILNHSNNIILGTITAGNWHKIEMRLKLNDNGASNGEFMFFFDDQLTSHMTGMSNMVPDNTYAITHSRFWVYYSWPGSNTGGPGKFLIRFYRFFEVEYDN